jgi:protein SCO1/2
MKSSALVFWLTLAVVGSAAYGSWVAWRNLHDDHKSGAQSASAANHLPPVVGPPIKDFQLTNRDGKDFDSKDLQGHVWIGSFFFASCPGSCWQMNQAIKGLQDEIKDDNLRIVSITCDPENDTTQALQVYANRVLADPRWLFLTGDFNYIRRIGRDVFLQDIQKATHTFRALAIGKDGNIRGSFDMLDPTKIAELKTLLKELLTEKPAPVDDAQAAATETPTADDAKPEAAK